MTRVGLGLMVFCSIIKEYTDADKKVQCTYFLLYKWATTEMILLKADFILIALFYIESNFLFGFPVTIVFKKIFQWK